MAAEATLNTIIEDARLYAEESYDSGDSLIRKAQQAARSYILGPDYQARQVSIDDIEVADVDDPGAFTGSITIPSGRPSLGDFDPVHIPVFQDIREAPDPIDTSDLFQHPVPDGEIPPLDANVPDLEDIVAPDAPTIDDVVLPTLREIDMPTAPSVSLPQFEGILPTNPPAAPTDLKCLFEDSYNQMLPQMQSYIDNQVTAFIEKYYPDYSANMAAAQTRLEEMLNGKALPDEIEQAIFDRARGRVERETVQAEDAAYVDVARRGFTMPQGVLVSELQRGHQAAADRISQAAIDIAVKQAEIAQSNLQFAINAVLTLQDGVRNSAIQYAGTLVQTNQAALEYGKTMVRSAIDLYDIQVKQFNSEVDLYRAMSNVYELQIKAELAKIEIFEAEVKMAELQGELNKLDVELVAQQVAISRNRIELYAEQLRASGLELNLQGQKLEVYKTQVETYLAQVKVKELEFNIYEAAMRGDETKVRANLAEFEAYKSEAAAKTAAGNLEVEQMKGDILRNTNVIDIYKAEVQEYLANVDINKTKFDGEVRAYIAGLERYSKQIDKALSEAKFSLDAQVADIDAEYKHQALEIEAETQKVRKFVDLTRIEADTAINGAQIFARIAEAAVSAQHTMVQLVNQTVQ